MLGRIALALLCCLAACVPPGAPTPGRPVVVAAVYPLAFAAQRIAGGRAEVVNLTPPGVEPHDVELTARQVAELAEADIVLLLGPAFQPAVVEAARDVGSGAVDVLEAAHGPGAALLKDSAGEPDPHVWLDPSWMVSVTRLLEGRLADEDPESSGLYERNAAELIDEVRTLDAELSAGLRSCRRREIVVGHDAFAYLAARYELTQVGIAGADPEVEPSPRGIARAIELAREHGVTTIFFERLVPADAAETIAHEIGVETAVLDPLESPPERGDYFSAMRSNLEALRSALGCS